MVHLVFDETMCRERSCTIYPEAQWDDPLHVLGKSFHHSTTYQMLIEIHFSLTIGYIVDWIGIHLLPPIIL